MRTGKTRMWQAASLGLAASLVLWTPSKSLALGTDHNQVKPGEFVIDRPTLINILALSGSSRERPQS
jgi:hypothetical protein